MVAQLGRAYTAGNLKREPFFFFFCQIDKRSTRLCLDCGMNANLALNNTGSFRKDPIQYLAVYSFHYLAVFPFSNFRENIHFSKQGLNVRVRNDHFRDLMHKPS